MGASANPSGNNQKGSSETKKGSSSSSVAKNGVAVNGGNSAAAVDNSQTINGLKHKFSISNEWSHEEQSLLDDLLAKYATDPTIVRYAKISKEMKNKTIRDIVLRRRWMTKKENGKRRKEDHSSRKSKDRKQEKATDSSAKSSSQLNVSGPSYTPPLTLVDGDDGVTYKDIGGASGDLLEQNAEMLNQISSNFASLQLDNLDMLSKARDNILAIMNDWDDLPESMKQMQPLPVKLNEELINLMLPPRPSESHD